MTYFSKLFSRNNTHLAVGITAGVVAVGLQILPHTIFLETYKDICTARRHTGQKIYPTKENQEIFEEVLNDLAISKDTRNILKPYIVAGYYAVHGGTFRKPYGGVIGIPENFNYHSTADINRIDWIINFQTVTWVDEDADKAKLSLLLSKEAQKFSIAREILRLQKEEPISVTIGLAIIVTILLFIYSNVYKRFALKEKSRLARIGIQSCFVLLAVALRIALVDYIGYNNDKEIDEVLSKLGPEYVTGGIELYQKLLDRNAAIRKPMGKAGERWFTVDGDEKYIYRCKQAPLTKKKSFLEQRFQDLYHIA